MRTNRRTKRNVRRGFTLIEVLLVAGILALLAAFVVPNLIGASQEAKISMAKAAVGRSGPIAKQITKYHFDNSTLPEELADLVSREVPGSLDMEEKDWKGPYIEDADSLLDPWGIEYQFRAPGEVNEEGYDLWSNGPDKEEGTDDDVTNWRAEN